MAFLVASLVALVAIIAAFRQTIGLRRLAKENREYRKRFEPVFEVDAYVAELEKGAQEIVDQEKYLLEKIDRAKQELDALEEAVFKRQDDERLIAVGYYEPVYSFEDIETYQKKYRAIKEGQKRMLRMPGETMVRDAAAYATKSFAVNGSDAEGRVFLRALLELMLRAFNGECDSLIARVSYKNISLTKKRIESAFEQINRLSRRWECELSDLYLDSRVQELALVYEWEEAKQREKDEQARIREQIREEERAAREVERARQQVDKEEVKFQELLQKARQEAQIASEKDKIRLGTKIEELMQRIAEIEEKKRAISQAMLTKTGHVYIISNVGSFGENVYKIGMTRRLEPMDRVKELGDASVPFPFDVHAMILSSDAPRLENALHNHFASRRVNLENERKEFFRVSIDEIREELEQLKDALGIDSELRLTLLAEAKEFRMSEARRKSLDASRP